MFLQYIVKVLFEKNHLNYLKVYGKNNTMEYESKMHMSSKLEIYLVNKMKGKVLICVTSPAEKKLKVISFEIVEQNATWEVLSHTITCTYLTGLSIALSYLKVAKL